MRSFSRFLRTISILITTAALVIGASGCSLYLLQNLGGISSSTDPESGVEKVICCKEQITLAWDPPPSEVSSYKIFYRPHESGSWILFDETLADENPEYTLNHADFGNGDYEFGVVAVDGEAAESGMHTSLDHSAQPDCGWYLSWVI